MRQVQNLFAQFSDLHFWQIYTGVGVIIGGSTNFYIFFKTGICCFMQHGLPIHIHIVTFPHTVFGAS